MPGSEKLTFKGAHGGDLAARLDLPDEPPRAYAVFAHCFTCSKDIFAASRIASGLARRGIAVVRFDFTGLGASDGEFASTNFSSNVEDLLKAVEYLREHHQAPAILIGHSLGGAAILAAAPDVPEARAVATIGAPADAQHVIHNFSANLDEIEKGEAEVSLAGRKFTIRKQFIDDLRAQDVSERIGKLKKALLVFHAPRDETVGIENASTIFLAARHPKSFVSLDDADHLLSRHEDAAYVADVLSAWAERYLGDGKDSEKTKGEAPEEGVLVSETGKGKFQQKVSSGGHVLMADEPESHGGLDSGPSPYDFLSIALGACTAMTLRLYAEHKKMELGRISVGVEHGKVHAKDCADCGEGRDGRIDRFERTISIAGGADEDIHDKLIEIAGKCPVHRTLEKEAAVVTKIAD